MTSLWVTNTTDKVRGNKADLCKTKTTAGSTDRGCCSVLITDSFIAGLSCLSISHSATDCGGRRIDLFLRQESFDRVRLSAFIPSSEGLNGLTASMRCAETNIRMDLHLSVAFKDIVHSTVRPVQDSIDWLTLVFCYFFHVDISSTTEFEMWALMHSGAFII